MTERKQIDTLRPLERGRVGRQPQLNLTSPDRSADYVFTPSELSLVDQQTWEDFWSNLVDEYEHLCPDFADAA
jgi:hypothetical protein